MPDDVYAPDQIEALKIAGELIDAGIAVFAAPPCKGPDCRIDGHSGKPLDYDFPPKWQQTYPSRMWLEKWRPGWALAMVGGRVADVLDVDPRNGGDASIDVLNDAGDMPRIFGAQLTPSGGRHYLISALGEAKSTPLPGLDVQGGAPDGTGRGFAWIAPTVRLSKLTGEPVAYRWYSKPDTMRLLEHRREDGSCSDESIAGLVSRVRESRASRAAPAAAGDDPFVMASAASGGERAFTLAQAQDFVRPHLIALRSARVGTIEERGMAATLALEHFVPTFWTPEQAFGLLQVELAQTAYDPNGPSGWTADKFLQRLDGRRPVLDSWHATRRPDAASVAASPAGRDDVEALLAEMLSPAAVATRPPPRPLIRGLLNFDSEAWCIGPPGSKKSFVVLDQAAHVARGLPLWQGLKVTQARVVMIVAEGAGGLGPRIRAWEKEHGAMGGEVFILPRPVQAANAKEWAVLVSACARLRPGLVVLDTQARVTVGLEENSATDMGLFVHAIGAIREATGACVLPVHHTGRSGGDARGSSAIDGAQGTEYKITSDGLHALLRVEKQKDMEVIPDIELSFKVIDLGMSDDGDPISSLVLISDPFDVASGAGKPVDVGQERTVAEPELWTRSVTHANAEMQRRILQTVHDIAREEGLTEAKVKALVASRWHGGQTGKGDGQLNIQAFEKAWQRVLTLEHEGERVIANVGGRRYALNGALDLSDLS